MERRKPSSCNSAYLTDGLPEIPISVRTDFEYGHSPEKSHDYALGSWEGVGTSSEDTARKIALLTTIPAYIDKVDG